MFSEQQKKNWQENKEKIMQQRCESGHYDDLGDKIKAWIDANPDKWKERMLKINKDPEKIRKTVEHRVRTHLSEDIKKKISDKRKVLL